MYGLRIRCDAFIFTLVHWELRDHQAFWKNGHHNSNAQNQGKCLFVVCGEWMGVMYVIW